jgi:hypothetical protein
VLVAACGSSSSSGARTTGVQEGASATTTPASNALGAAMAKLKLRAAGLGTPSVSGGVLSFGSTTVNGDFGVVDAVAAEFGCTATFFAANGGSFVRVSTNVIKDGKRAVGTQLDPNGPVIVRVRDGRSFAGVVDILGDRYDTIYEPIVDTKGVVVGVYYVGVKL